MESLRLEEENIIKDIRNIFRLKIFFFRNLFEHEEEDYYKSVIINNFHSNNYI